MNKILVTAYPKDTVEEEAKKSGVQSFIRKPFDAKEIEKALVQIEDTVKKKFLP